jgi:hypothetical protein
MRSDTADEILQRLCWEIRSHHQHHRHRPDHPDPRQVAPGMEAKLQVRRRSDDGNTEPLKV